MEKFSKLKPKSEFNDDKDNILYSDDYMTIISYEDWSILKEADNAVCIPYLIETNQIIIRQEYVPTFKYADGQEYHVVVLSGTIEKGESPERTILRELEEEAGIVLREDYKIQFMKPLFKSKGCVDKYYPCIIPLTERDYHEVIAKGDGSDAEKLSRSVKIDIKHIKSLNASDLISEYMFNKMLEYSNQSATY